MRTYKEAKAMAKSLRESLAAKNVSLSHSECLEIVARQFGFAGWNILAAKLGVEAGVRSSRDDDAIELQPPIPQIQVTSMQEARAFYVDYLGFAFDWGDDGQNHKLPPYAQVSRSDVTLHLDENANVRPSAKVLIRMSGMDALHRELSAKMGLFAPSEIQSTPFDSRVFGVADPFGNWLRYWENNPPGVAG